ncbi:S8 family serine peptidase [Brevundimonas sp. GCM10030266]|uniref:S8 family serine peptidase n=1 Tax=Brevundimonas sp. GCM10030266 TaxID=3273386 RepID=UPI0036153718
MKTALAGWTAALLLAAATPVCAQIGLPQTPGLPALPSGVTDRLPAVGRADALGRETLDRALQAPSRLTGLVRRSGGALEADPNGWPVAAAEIVAVDLSEAARAEALRAGFTVVREDRLEALDLAAVVLAPPRRLSLARAVERLKALDPAAEVTFNHIHSPAGIETAAPGSAGPAPPGPQGLGARLGLIDTGVEATHPALTGSAIIQRGFAGPPRLGAHGTAVASLMVGRSGAFSGADPGGSLLVADIYGGQSTGGSSTGLASALAWMVEQRVRVVNISLVGPRNPLVERAVARAQSRGVVIVAAAGNDGPAASALYPAAYDGVVGVSAVNSRNQILPESGRGPQVDFAAPGADMAAAGQAGSWTSVRGSSFAAPLVAGLLARRGGGPASVEALARSATDRGARGRDPVYGQGLVGADLRVAPAAVGARGRLSR